MPDTSSPTLVKLRGVSKTFGSEPNRVFALRGVDLDVFPGEYLSIMGPSGSGKSTLFNMIGGLDRYSEGEVEIGGVKLGDLTDGQLAYFRGRHIGYVFQAYNLIPSMTAIRNVALPALFAGCSPREAEERATTVLTKVGLDHRMHHRPDELSGGQQQRVAIARALVNTPTIILADEPTANLDLKTGEQIIELLQQLCRESGITIITATHDHKMLKASHRIVWIKDGRVDKIERVEDLKIEEGSLH